MGWLYDRWVVERTRFEVHVFRMLRGCRVDRRPALRAKIAGELIAAVGALGIALGRAAEDSKLRRVAADSDIEGASCASPAILAVAVVCGSESPGVLVCNVTAEAAPVDRGTHVVLLFNLRRVLRSLTVIHQTDQSVLLKFAEHARAQ
jgi:hypothetical protein